MLHGINSSYLDLFMFQVGCCMQTFFRVFVVFNFILDRLSLLEYPIILFTGLYVRVWLLSGFSWRWCFIAQVQPCTRHRTIFWMARVIWSLSPVRCMPFFLCTIFWGNWIVFLLLILFPPVWEVCFNFRSFLNFFLSLARFWSESTIDFLVA